MCLKKVSALFAVCISPIISRLSPKILHNHFSWVLHSSQEKLKTMLMQFGGRGGGGAKQGVLWEMCKIMEYGSVCLKRIALLKGQIRSFFRRGALVSCSTSTTINHKVFFLQNTSCIRTLQVILGGGVHTPCTLPLDPPLCYHINDNSKNLHVTCAYYLSCTLGNKPGDKKNIYLGALSICENWPAGPLPDQSV